jgi:hypothetical protein
VFGLHVGHVLLAVKSPVARLWHWGTISVLQLVLGLILHFAANLPMNTDLYSLAYLLVSGGAAGLMVCIFYSVVDIHRMWLWLWNPFMYMGMNAISMYLFAEGDVISWAVGNFYLGDEDRSLANILWPTGVYWGDSSDNSDLPLEPSHNIAILMWTLGYIALTALIAWYMYKRKCFIVI